MSDIVARLRKNAEIVSHEDWYWLNPLLVEAAREIESLTSEVAAMENDRDAWRERAISLDARLA